MAKVGQRGSAASNRWIGKLLLMPPSENQHTRNAVITGPQAWPALVRPSMLSATLCPASPPAVDVGSQRRSRREGSCSGTALISSGKLRLMRVATSTGNDAPCGRW
ncbi:hypothetical protein D3C73_1366980 [compost metagenome]